MFQVESTIYIHATPPAVWLQFARLEEWPRWNSEILAAEWLQGEKWHEGSVFVLHHHSLLGSTKRTTATLKMVVVAQSVVWESQSMGITVVNSARFADSTGGCRLTARHSYHGALSLPLRLFRQRQQHALEGAMRELKEAVEEPLA